MTEQITPAAGSPEAHFLALIALMADPQAAKARFLEFIAERTGAEKAIAALESAKAAWALEKAAQETALAKRKQELDAYSDSLSKLSSEIKQTKETIFGARDQIQRLDVQMKFAIMNYGGLLQGFNERLQEMPSWESLNRELLGRSDAHFDNNDTSTARGEVSTEIERVPDAPEYATIRRSKSSRPSRADH
jgi:chromosome segregation ATPase